MATKVRIGHASTDEASTTAAEVLIGNYYESLNPTVVLRPVKANIAEKSAATCEAGCNNNKIRYSQAKRNTLYTEAKKVDFNLANITTECFADCSSFMTICAVAAGANISTASMPNCGSMRQAFTKNGDYKALTASKYLNSSDYLQRGDILVRENYVNGSRHTVMILDNGSKVPASGANVVPTTEDLPANITTLKIAVNISNINDTELSATAKLIKVDNGIEKPLTSLDSLNAYKWTYKLECVGSNSTKGLIEKLSIESSAIKLFLNNLLPGKSYSLQVFAAELRGNAEFSSQRIIFTTVKKPKQYSSESKPVVSARLPRVNRLYVKVKDGFKQAIIYNNI